MGKLTIAVMILMFGLSAQAQVNCQNYPSAKSILLTDIRKHFLKKVNVFERTSDDQKSACDAAQNSSDFNLQDGDVIFIGLDSQLYTRVAISTNTWVSHVGVAFGEVNPRTGAKSWYVYESAPLKGRKSPLCKYIGRAKNLRYAIARSQSPISVEQKESILNYLKAHHGSTYHLGFNYDAKGYQFCSKLVREAYLTAGLEFGQFEPLANLVDNFDETAGLSGKYGPPMSKNEVLCFWESYFGMCRGSGKTMAKICEYFGGDDPNHLDGVIPRGRMTVTPASQFNQALLGKDFSIVLDYKP